MANEKNTVNVADELKFKLSRPFVFEEQEYTELTLDFGSLKGADLLQIDKNIGAEGAMNFVKPLSLPFQLHVAAAAAKVPVIFFDKLPANDTLRIAQRAQNFLLN